MKKDKPDNSDIFPLGIRQRGGLVITLSKREILKELTFMQKILFLLGLRRFTSTDDIEIRIGKLGARIAHDEIFGYDSDFGKTLFTINVEIGKKNWEVEKHLTPKDLEKASAIVDSNIMIRNRFIGLVSDPPLSLSLYNFWPEVCLTIAPMTPYVLVQSIRHFVDVNPHYTFSAIRQSNHVYKDKLIAFVYELLDIQSNTAIGLMEYLELCHTIKQKKGDSILIKEEKDAVEKTKLLVVTLKSFIEKIVAFVGVVYGDPSIDSIKTHGKRVAKIASFVTDNYRKEIYYDKLLEYIKSDNFAELNNYRTGVLHKKGSSKMQPHSFVGKNFKETPLMDFLTLFRRHHAGNSLALLSALAIMTDELVNKEPPQKRFAMLLDLFDLMDKLNLVKREEQINMLPAILPKIFIMYKEHFGVKDTQENEQSEAPASST